MFCCYAVNTETGSSNKPGIRDDNYETTTLLLSAICKHTAVYRPTQDQRNS